MFKHVQHFTKLYNTLQKLYTTSQNYTQFYKQNEQTLDKTWQIIAQHNKTLHNFTNKGKLDKLDTTWPNFNTLQKNFEKPHTKVWNFTQAQPNFLQNSRKHDKDFTQLENSTRLYNTFTIRHKTVQQSQTLYAKFTKNFFNSTNKTLQHLTKLLQHYTQPYKFVFKHNKLYRTLQQLSNTHQEIYNNSLHNFAQLHKTLQNFSKTLANTLAQL